MDLRAAASQIKSIWIKEKSGFPLFSLSKKSSESWAFSHV